MNMWFLAAGFGSLFICWVHVVFGGKDIARPLLATENISRMVKYTHYYCWHMVSIVLGVMGLMFLWAAKYQSGVELAFTASVFALAFTLWSLGIVAINKGRWKLFPQWILFAPVAIIGIIGLVYG